jgi:ribosome maturation factor RimP
MNVKLKKIQKKTSGEFTGNTPPIPSEGGVSLKKTEDIVAKAWELAEPLCLSEGMELIHVEFQRESGGRILRLYIDKPGGITVDDCATVSSQLGDILDIKLDTEYPYTLEVSSPGIDRPMSRFSDFIKFKGQTAKIRTAYPINGQKNFKGILQDVMDDTIVLQTDAGTAVIPFREITKARLVNLNGDNTC